MSEPDTSVNTVKFERLSLFPIRPDERKVWELYQKQEANSWSVGEVNLADDVKDYPHLSPLEKQVFDITIARFNVADKPVVDNLACLGDFIRRDDLVRQMMLNSQARIEGIHMHMYGLFLTNIVEDPVRREQLQIGVLQYPSIKKAVELVRRYQKKGTSLRTFLISQACAEGIGFSTTFANALYFKTVGKMHGFAYGNTKVMQDEHLHYQHACEWFLELEDGKDGISNPMTNDVTFHSIVQDYVDIEVEFAREALGDAKLGILSAQSLGDYARYIANLLCINCNKPLIYDIKTNPLPYMDLTSLRGKTNFFERTVGDYKNISVTDAGASLTLDLNKRR